MLAAMACFVLNDTLVKLASATYPPGQLMAVRGLFAVAFAVLLIRASGGARPGMTGLRPVLTRSVLEAAVAALFITALAHLPLANITAILQTTPILLTVATVVLGLEQVGWRRWSAIAVGFLGVILIVQPSPEGFNAFALVAFASAVLAAARDLVTRRISSDISSPTVTLWSNLTVGALGFALVPFEGWRTLEAPATLLLVGAAGLVTLGSLALVVAYRSAEISVVAPFRYSVVVLAIVLGFLIFGEWPDPLACIGIALVVASGVYTIHREQARRRAARSSEAALGQPSEARGHPNPTLLPRSGRSSRA
jgi:drug/metabolite transporter (DMT)-like permease